MNSFEVLAVFIFLALPWVVGALVFLWELGYLARKVYSKQKGA